MCVCICERQREMKNNNNKNDLVAHTLKDSVQDLKTLIYEIYNTCDTVVDGKREREVDDFTYVILS